MDIELSISNMRMDVKQLSLIYKNRLSDSVNKFEFNAEEKLGYLTIRGIFFESQSREICENIMGFIEREQMVGMVVDILEMQGTFSKLIGFAKDEFLPHLIKYKCTRVGVALDNNFFALFAMQQLLKVLKIGIEIKIFRTVEEAYNWTKRNKNYERIG